MIPDWHCFQSTPISFSVLYSFLPPTQPTCHRRLIALFVSQCERWWVILPFPIATAASYRKERWLPTNSHQLWRNDDEMRLPCVWCRCSPTIGKNNDFKSFYFWDTKQQPLLLLRITYEFACAQLTPFRVKCSVLRLRSSKFRDKCWFFHRYCNACEWECVRLCTRCVIPLEKREFFRRTNCNMTDAWSYLTLMTSFI